MSSGDDLATIVVYGGRMRMKGDARKGRLLPDERDHAYDYFGPGFRSTFAAQAASGQPPTALTSC